MPLWGTAGCVDYWGWLPFGKVTDLDPCLRLAVGALIRAEFVSSNHWHSRSLAFLSTVIRMFKVHHKWPLCGRWWALWLFLLTDSSLGVSYKWIALSDEKGVVNLRYSQISHTVKSSMEEIPNACAYSAWIIMGKRGCVRVFRTTRSSPLPPGISVCNHQRERPIWPILEAAAAGDHTGSLVNLFLKEL